MDTSLVVAVLVNLVVSAVAIGLLMAVCLLLSVRLKQWSFIDTLWGLGFVLVAVVSFVLAGPSGHPQRKAAMLLVTALWGIRLATHLFRRSRSVGERVIPIQCPYCYPKGQYQSDICRCSVSVVSR